jgi:hypothetical protein
MPLSSLYHLDVYGQYSNISNNHYFVGVFQAVSHINIVFNSLSFYGLPTISMVKHQDYLYVMILKAVFTLAKVVSKNA